MEIGEEKMDKIKEHDFIELDYVGKIKETGDVFDTTKEDIAKANDLHNEKTKYGPVIICVGEHNIIQGLDKALLETDKDNFTVELAPEEAFGKKTMKLIQLLPTAKFRKENIMPQPGLQINVDGNFGIVKTVTGGRTMVDFNHPLSGKDVIYDIEIKRIVTDAKEKIDALLKNNLGIASEKTTITEGNASVELKIELPKEVSEVISKKITDIVTVVKKVDFTVSKPAEKKENK